MKKITISIISIAVAALLIQAADLTPIIPTTPNIFRLSVFDESAGLIASFNTSVEPGAILILTPNRLVSGVEKAEYSNKLLYVKTRTAIYASNFVVVQINVSTNK